MDAAFSTPDSDELVVIPARWGSTRFPGKPLLLLAGKPLVEHVWLRCREVAGSPPVVIATDDERIAQAARDFGADVAMTRDDHPSGTDRVAEVAASRPEARFLVNVQGDEPLLEPGLVRQLLDVLKSESAPEVVTAACPLENDSEFADPNVVKVVLDAHGDALYFSRAPIPHDRDGSPPAPRLRHLGVYGFQREFLLRFVETEPSPLERTEALEQLRALESGARIHVSLVDHVSPGVDTPEQAAAVESLLPSSSPNPTP